MNDFLNKLYSYQNFSFYLIISIIVLVVLFFVVLFYGKKDKKKREIEVTKRLQQIESEDTFKEEDTREKVELKEIEQEKLENDTIAVPTIEDFYNQENNNDNNWQQLEDENVEVPTINPEKDLFAELSKEEEKTNEVQPLFNKEEEKPLVFESVSNELDERKEDIIPNKEINKLEEVEVPTFNFEEIMKSAEIKKDETILEPGPIKNQEIYSSVFVPPKEEPKIPIIESEPKFENISTKDEKIEPVIPVKKEELEFELPVLKKVEEKEVPKEIEMPVLNNYNLDELSGETYTINK